MNTPDTLEEQDQVQNQEAYNNISWLDKYRPTTLDNYYISKAQLNVVKTWIDDFRNNTEDAKPFLILYGTPGIGKTTLAYLILNFYDYEIIECNASDSRTKKNIRETLGQISKVTVCIDDDDNFKKLAIIMDEIDGLVGGESNSVQELIDIVTKDKDSKKDWTKTWTTWDPKNASYGAITDSTTLNDASGEKSITGTLTLSASQVYLLKTLFHVQTF